MRLAWKTSRMGYIILPVVISPDQEPDQALDDNKTFQVVWSVLRCPAQPRRPLRPGDQLAGPEQNSLLNASFILNGGGDDNGPDPMFPVCLLDLVYKIPPGAIYATHCREVRRPQVLANQWAADRGPVLRISHTLSARNHLAMIRSPERITLREDFHSFLADSAARTLNPACRKMTWWRWWPST